VDGAAAYVIYATTALIVISGMLLTGCLLKSATVPARHFVLTPIPAEESSPAQKEHAWFEIGFIKMPAYLLRDSIAIRNGTNEIEYLENALWAERLDQSFQRALMADLCRSVAADNTHFAGTDRKKESVRIFITVHQFDVDTRGHGTLVAQWRIAAPDGNELMSGHASLARTGRPPRGDPAAIAATMSELTAEFSNELARSLKGSAKAGTNLP
jgi:uncharacterized lipoprotein YmbA